MKVAFFILGLFCANQVYADEPTDPTDPGVYFRFTEREWWRKCYATDQASALQAIHENKIELPSFLKNIQATADGSDISLSFEFSGKSYQHTLYPCPFTLADRQEDLSCTVEVRTAQSTPYLSDYYSRIQKKWNARGYRESLVDCGEKKARTITNSWPVSTTMAEFKLAQFLEQRRIPMVPAIAGGHIRQEGSLNPYQDWSASFGFSLLKGSDMYRPEVCDAGIEQLSAEGNESWAGIYWCPWAIEIVSLHCKQDEQELSVKSEVVPEWLSVADQDLSAWCN